MGLLISGLPQLPSAHMSPVGTAEVGCMLYLVLSAVKGVPSYISWLLVISIADAKFRGVWSFLVLALGAKDETERSRGILSPHICSLPFHQQENVLSEPFLAPSSFMLSFI